MMNKYILVIAFLLCVINISCDSLLDIDSDEFLPSDEHYTEANEVYAAFIGIASGVQKVAEQVIIVPEVRGDLLTPTSNATEAFWQLHRQERAVSSALGSPRDLYNLCIICDDFIKHCQIFNEKNPNVLPSDAYKGMISNAIVTKTWSYLMISKLWGEVDITMKKEISKITL